MRTLQQIKVHEFDYFRGTKKIHKTRDLIMAWVQLNINPVISKLTAVRDKPNQLEFISVRVDEFVSYVYVLKYKKLFNFLDTFKNQVDLFCLRDY